MKQSKKSIYNTNYEHLETLGIVKDGKLRTYAKSKAGGFTDLVCERLPLLDNFNSQGTLAISIAHYFKQNGDLCCDPDMVLFLHPELKSVEAYSFQQAIPCAYHVVYPEPGKVCTVLRQQLNTFLEQWLTILIEQGHGKVWEESAEVA